MGASVLCEWARRLGASLGRVGPLRSLHIHDYLSRSHSRGTMNICGPSASVHAPTGGVVTGVRVWVLCYVMLGSLVFK